MWTFWNKYQATFPSPHPHPTPINLFDLFGWQERSCRVCRSVTSIRFIHLFLFYWGGGRLCGDAMLSSLATPKVSFRQLTVQPVIRMSSEWRPFRFQWASKDSSDSGAMCAGRVTMRSVSHCDFCLCGVPPKIAVIVARCVQGGSQWDQSLIVTSVCVECLQR